MIMTRKVEGFTDEHRAALKDHAKSELAKLGKISDHMFYMSEIWEIREDGELLGIYGFYRPSIVIQPMFWFALCQGFKLGHVRAFRFFVEHYKAGRENVWTSVEVGFEAGHRFAEFCGFAATDEVYEVDGVKYLKYRAAYS